MAQTVYLLLELPVGEQKHLSELKSKLDSKGNFGDHHNLTQK